MSSTPPEAPPDAHTLFSQYIEKAGELESLEADEKEPYKNKYAAREVLVSGRAVLQAKGEDVLVARLKVRIGINLYLTEENTEGEKTLVEAAKTLEGPNVYDKWIETWKASQSLGATSPPQCDEAALVDLINAYNYLGILWSHRALGNETAQQYLERARHLYLLTKGRQENQRRQDKEVCEKTTNELEEAHTSTLFFLAQVYTSQGKAAQGADMCSCTLSRQRRFQHSFEPTRWARDAIGLSAYFGVGIGKTRQASHFLAAALRALPDQQDEDIKVLLADLLRAKGALYLEILSQASAARENPDKALAGHWQRAEQQTHLEISETIDDEYEKDTAPPPVQQVIDFESAREVFKVANNSFEKAKEYYVLDGFATDHIQILQSQSQLYRHISSFEEDYKRFVAMQARREKLLSSLLDDLNAEFYAVQHQEIAYELGEACREILAAHLDAIGNPELGNLSKLCALKPAEIKKVNDAAMKVVKYYSHFAKTFEAAEAKDEKSGVGAATPEESVPYVLSHFWVAHAYHKMISPDPKSVQAHILLLSESLKYFEKTLKLAQQRIPKDSPLLQTERKICADMVQLLPLHINNVHTSRGLIR